MLSAVPLSHNPTCLPGNSAPFDVCLVPWRSAVQLLSVGTLDCHQAYFVPLVWIVGSLSAVLQTLVVWLSFELHAVPWSLGFLGALPGCIHWETQSQVALSSFVPERLQKLETYPSRPSSQVCHFWAMGWLQVVSWSTSATISHSFVAHQLTLALCHGQSSSGSCQHVSALCQ